MHRNILFILFIFFLVSLKAQPAENAIQKVLADQEKAWNAGNIDAFMEGYWQSDSLTFIGANGITRGWKQTLENYKIRYPDRKTMGKLRFEILSIRMLGKSNSQVIGTWHLTRDVGDIGGIFTLLWEKVNGQWVIISDHTSVSP